MGNYNVDAAYTLFGGLKHRTHRALTYMARRALDPPGMDGQEPLLYFGGHAELAAALGLVPFGTPWHAVTKSHRNHVREVVKELKEAGAADLVSGGRGTAPARYRLNLVPAALAEGQDPQNGGLSGPPKKRRQDPRNGGLETPKTGVQRGRGGLRTRDEEDNSPDPATSPAPDAPVNNPEFDEMTTEQANRELIKRHGLEHGVNLLAQHAAVHAECDNPAGHVLAITPTFRVIEGGKSA